MAEEDSELPPIESGRAHLLREDGDIALLAVGVMTDIALETADLLEKEGYSVAVANARFVKPLDAELILNLASVCSLVVTMEENTLKGGFGSGVLETLNEAGVTSRTLSFGIPDRYIAQGSPDEQRKNAELTPILMAKKIRERLKKSQLPARKARRNVSRKKAS